MNASFPVIDLRGSHFDMGLAHGRALGRQIKANLSLYERMIAGLAGLSPEQAFGRTRPYVEFLREAAPGLLEEMRGIAEGAGVDLEAIVFLNARTELMSVRSGPGECTAVGISSLRTMGGSPFLAQNWDWHYRLAGSSALFRAAPPGGPRCLYLAEAGQVGKIGLNEAGVGVLLNILFCGRVRVGMPVHVLLRLVLCAGSVPEAIDMVRRLPRASSSHFLLGDAEDRISGLEITPEKVFEIPSDKGVLVHTNHFCDPEMSASDEGPALFPDSTARMERGRSFLALRDRWDAEGVKVLFVNHDNGPASICRHVDPKVPEHMKIVTVASVFLHLQDRAMEIACGQPCRNTYHRVPLEI